MPDSSSGNFSLVPGYIAVTGQTISASQHNPPLEDIAAAMTRRYMRDGRTPMLGDIPMNGYRATGAGDAVEPQDYLTLAQAQALSGMFPGFMQVDTCSSTGSPPAGWLHANGQSVSRESYPELWARVQAGNNLAATQAGKTHGQYGPGNGATTFTLPNLYADEGYFIRPISSGRAIGTVQADGFKSHDHGGQSGLAGEHRHEADDSYVGGSGDVQGGGGFGRLVRSIFTTLAPNHRHTIPSEGGTETRPKNIAYPVLIKAS